MMREKHFRNVMISTLAVFLMLVPLASCSTPGKTVTLSEAPGGEQGTVIEHASVQFDARESAPDVNATTKTQEISIKDGRTIIENNCTQCHLPQSLLQIKKSRSEWEEALQQMAKMGVHLSDTDKVVLIDFLVNSEEP